MSDRQRAPRTEPFDIMGWGMLVVLLAFVLVVLGIENPLSDIFLHMLGWYPT